MGKDRMDTLVKAAARVAAGMAGVEEGIACAGTAIESRTYKLKERAFVFVRPGNIMLKLGPSLAEAAAMAKRATPPGSLKAGAGGWVTITRGCAEVSAAMVTQWVKESHGLFAAGAVAGAKKSGKKAGKNAAATSRRRAGANKAAHK